jgi:hypothetical protein
MNACCKSATVRLEIQSATRKPILMCGKCWLAATKATPEAKPVALTRGKRK